jgi:formylglycine-generating enzyme required for sulfatase activity/uncharacterized caspase-like protein
MASKIALVIANTEYQDVSFAKLTAPGKDAEEFARVLRDPELAAFDDVQVLLNESEGKTRRTVARFFANHKRDDLLLLYFSGHGIRNGQGQLFLAASDTEINLLEATSIPAEFVTYAMNNSRSQRQLLILDCCNSGAFAYGSKSAAVVGKSMGIASAFEGSGFGRVVLTATDATQYAWEGDKLIGDTQNSVFTHFLIEGMKGEADRNGDGRIDVDELYEYAYEQVVCRTPKQTPGKWSYKQQGDIVLRENLKPSEVKLAPLPSALLEMLAHPNSGVRRAAIQDLTDLLDGKHLGLARAAQEGLREIAENDDSLTLRKIANETLIAHGLRTEQPPNISTKSQAVKPEERSQKLPVSPQVISTEAFGEGIRSEVSASKKNKSVRKLNSRLISISGGAVALLLITFCLWGVTRPLSNLPFFAPKLTPTLQSTPTHTPQSIGTSTPSPTKTAIPPTPTLGIGSTKTGNDGMTLLYVPAGNFTMGSDSGSSSEKPTHSVHLDAFWIDTTEVTNAMYAKCVRDKVCNAPSQIRSAKRDSYYGNPDFDNYPVIYVSWDDATDYCSWAGRRLPTEAEWEKAARGDDARDYPWGNSAPNEKILNDNGIVGDTTEVGNYPKGSSPYGALDMAGNVSEWVVDWYRELYYTDQPESNPPGPDQGSARVLRGGSWITNLCISSYNNQPESCGRGDSWFTSSWDPNTVIYSTYHRDPVITIYTWRRKWDAPTVANNYYGFRCAKSAMP